MLAVLFFGNNGINIFIYSTQFVSLPSLLIKEGRRHFYLRPSPSPLGRDVPQHRLYPPPPHLLRPEDHPALGLEVVQAVLLRRVDGPLEKIICFYATCIRKRTIVYCFSNKSIYGIVLSGKPAFLEKKCKHFEHTTLATQKNLKLKKIKASLKIDIFLFYSI